VAKEYSQCPSAKSGGSLGVFKPGQMVAEFDRWEIDREMDWERESTQRERAR
jgi:hypothetical protein